MVFLTKGLVSVMSEFSERVADLEKRLAVAESVSVQRQNQIERLDDKYRTDTNILSALLYHIIQGTGASDAYLTEFCNQSSYEGWRVREVLTYHEACPADWFMREFRVSVTVPVTVCLEVDAACEEDAEEMARDSVECNGIESYDMDYNLYYDAEFYVEEV